HIGIDLAQEIDVARMAGAIPAGIARMDLDPSARMAIAFAWRGGPEYSRLKAAAAAIINAGGQHRTRDTMLVLMIGGDVGRTLGHLLEHELDLPGRIVSIDGVQLQELDFVDIGALISPPGVVPVVIKSLLFGA